MTDLKLRASRTLDVATMSNTASDAQILLRPATGLLTGPIADELRFLESPSPPHSYRIRFRHPAYPDTNNVLLSLNAWDRAGGGIQYGLAHTACAIVANNRFDGYLSITRDPLGPQIELAWDDVLPHSSHGYYFHVRNNNDDIGQVSDRNLISDAASSSDPVQPLLQYRWPVVPCFMDWKFPHNRLPRAWQTCAETQRDSDHAAQSDQTGAVHQRDIVCTMSAHSTSTEVAHLVPVHERAWFETNDMGQYNSNTTLDASSLLHDPNNALLLRSDLHKAFDARKFCFFPKGHDGFVVHVLQSAPDLRLLYHNTQIPIHKCEVNYIFARFAWSIFPFLATFLSSKQKSRLVIEWDQMHGDWVESEVPPHILARKSAASRSNSPTKRSRIVSSVDDQGEQEQQCRARTFRSNRSIESMNDDNMRPVKARRLLSGGSDLAPPRTERPETPVLTEDEGTEKMRSATQSFQTTLHRDSSPQSPSESYTQHLRENRKASEHERWLDPQSLDRLRRIALAQQRPANYVKPEFKEDGDAREQLELMGVEIIDDPLTYEAGLE